jgi:hypothetical protein
MASKKKLKWTSKYKLLNSIIRLMGLNISSPDHTTISRRLASIKLDTSHLKIEALNRWHRLANLY